MAADSLTRIRLQGTEVGRIGTEDSRRSSQISAGGRGPRVLATACLHFDERRAFRQSAKDTPDAKVQMQCREAPPFDCDNPRHASTLATPAERSAFRLDALRVLAGLAQNKGQLRSGAVRLGEVA